MPSSVISSKSSITLCILSSICVTGFKSALLSFPILLLISLLCVPVTMNIMLDWHICQSSWWRNDMLPLSLMSSLHNPPCLLIFFFLVSYVCCFCCCYCHNQFLAAASFLHHWPSSTVLCSLCSFFSVFAVLNYCVLQFQSLADQFPHCIKPLSCKGILTSVYPIQCQLIFLKKWCVSPYLDMLWIGH